jgi:hypothetical protein
MLVDLQPSELAALATNRVNRTQRLVGRPSAEEALGCCWGMRQVLPVCALLTLVYRRIEWGGVVYTRNLFGRVRVLHRKSL